MKTNPPSDDPCREPAEIKASRAGGKSELAPGLYVTATPIGNARDISLRALDVIEGSDLIVAEDTRVTAKLFALHGLRKPLTVYNDHNAQRERPRLLAELRAGARVVLVSDAGTPLVSDPGFKLVREAIGEGLPVHVVPGASAALAALVLAGLPTDKFLFAGFLPSRSAERLRFLEELKDVRATLIIFESARRLGDTLKDMHAVLGDRLAAVTREITKLHEEVRRGTLADLTRHYAEGGAPKGEVTIVVGGAEAASKADTELLAPLLARAMAYMPLREAVDLIAESSGTSRKIVYERALKIKADARA